MCQGTFEVGQNVKVVDTQPSIAGTIEDVSTWKKLTGDIDSGVCYYVRCPDWGQAFWVGESFIESAE